MCIPIIQATTMASITGIQGASAFTLLDLIGVGAALGGVGTAYSSAQIQKDQYAFEDAKNRQKAIIRDRQAVDVIERGEEKARVEKSRLKGIESTQLVILAGQGGDVGTGTAVDLLAGTREFSERRQQQIRANARREAADIRADVTNIKADAAAARYASAAVSPSLQAGTTAVSAFSTVGAQWYKRGTG